MSVFMNITYRGQSGTYLAKLDPGVDDNSIRRLCEEAVRNHEVSGIMPNISQNAFTDHVIDRFNNDDGTTRLVIRPKVPFG